ncbi:MAG TPA: hypothetical protein VHL79_23985 [Ramlibacter sp.]|jgi:hypothetical protein|nr:hypothetical protein [Ramlibacter sp.]
MKKLLLPALLGLAAVFTAPASHALTATGGFDVTVNLYPKCEFVGAIPALTLNYVSFQTSASSNSTPFSVRCTGSLPYTFALTPATGTLVGLGYTLSTVDTSDVAATGGTGSGGSQTYAIKGTIAANLAGTCTQGNVGNTSAQSAGGSNAAGLGTACQGVASGVHTIVVTY